MLDYDGGTWSSFCVLERFKFKRERDPVLKLSEHMIIVDYGCRCFTQQIPKSIVVVDTPIGPTAHLLWPYSSASDRESFAQLKECQGQGVVIINIGAGPVVETVLRQGFAVHYRSNHE